MQAPVGLTFVTYENPRASAPPTNASARSKPAPDSPQADWFNHVNVNVHDHGGHFIAWENPDAWVSDLRRTFHDRNV